MILFVKAFWLYSRFHERHREYYSHLSRINLLGHFLVAFLSFSSYLLSNGDGDQYLKVGTPLLVNCFRSNFCSYLNRLVWGYYDLFSISYLGPIINYWDIFVLNCKIRAFHEGCSKAQRSLAFVITGYRMQQIIKSIMRVSSSGFAAHGPYKLSDSGGTIIRKLWSIEH